MRSSLAHPRTLAWLTSIALIAALAGCQDQTLNPPTAGPSTDTLFTTYVAFGNSVTAGFESAGINDSTQRLTYAAVLAKQMDTKFNMPLLTMPGCPPPFNDVFTQTRVGGLSASACFAREPGSVTPVINNVAVPGAAVIDLINNLDATSPWPSSPNPLTTFFLGGKTQLQAAEVAQPTFVTVWIGNNDVLGAVLDATNPGDSNLVTPPDTFAARYNAFMDSLDAIGSIKGGALVGVVPVSALPYLTQGRAWKAFEQYFDALTSPVNALDVANNCLAFQQLSATDTAWVGVPFPVGGAVLAAAQAKVDSVQAGTLNPLTMQPAVLDCGGASVVSVPEVVHILTAVAQYNATIAAAAQARGWVYLDPLPPFVQLAADPTAIRPFPAFDPSDPQHLSAPFGSAFSLDGIHPSASTHKLVANLLIQAINAKYGTSIPAAP